MFVVLLCLVLVSSSSGGELEIVKTSPQTLTREGDTVTLWCATSSRWFFCLWQTPGGGKQCGIQEKTKTTNTVCSGQPRLRLEGNTSHCSLTINGTTGADHGTWMCLVNDDKSFEIKKAFVGLGVAREAVVRLERDGEALGDVLTVTEGEAVEVACVVRGAFPRPYISWEAPPPGEDLGRTVIDTTRQVQYTPEYNSYTVNAEHVVVYHPLLAHTGSSLSCNVNQLDDDNNILYTNKDRVLLEVLAAVPPSPLTRRLGIVSGALLAVILVVLVCVLVVMVGLRKGRGRDGRGSSTSEETDLLKPIIWTTGDEEKQVTYEGQYMEVSQSHSLLMGGSVRYSGEYASNLHPDILLPDTSNLHPDYLLHTSSTTTLPRPAAATTSRTVSSGTVSVSSRSSSETERSVGGDLTFCSYLPSLGSSSSPSTLPRHQYQHHHGGAHHGGAHYSRPDNRVTNMHETHFGDNPFDQPRTVVRTFSKAPPPPPPHDPCQVSCRGPTCQGMPPAACQDHHGCQGHVYHICQVACPSLDPQGHYQVPQNLGGGHKSCWERASSSLGFSHPHQGERMRRGSSGVTKTIYDCEQGCFNHEKNILMEISDI